MQKSWLLYYHRIKTEKESIDLKGRKVKKTRNGIKNHNTTASILVTTFCQGTLTYYINISDCDLWYETKKNDTSVKFSPCVNYNFFHTVMENDECHTPSNKPYVNQITLIEQKLYQKSC